MHMSVHGSIFIRFCNSRKFFEFPVENFLWLILIFFPTVLVFGYTVRKNNQKTRLMINIGNCKKEIPNHFSKTHEIFLAPKRVVNHKSGAYLYQHIHTTTVLTLREVTFTKAFKTTAKRKRDIKNVAKNFETYFSTQNHVT